MFDFKYWQSKFIYLFILISVFISNWNNVQIFEIFFLFILELFWDFGIGNSSIKCRRQQIWAESRHLPGRQCAATRQHQLSTWTPYQLRSSANQNVESDVCLWRLSLTFVPELSANQCPPFWRLSQLGTLSFFKIFDNFSTENYIMLFNLLRFKQFSQLIGHTEPICKLSANSTGTMLASGGWFSTISVVYILKYLKD